MTLRLGARTKHYNLWLIQRAPGRSSPAAAAHESTANPAQLINIGCSKRTNDRLKQETNPLLRWQRESRNILKGIVLAECVRGFNKTHQLRVFPLHTYTHNPKQNEKGALVYHTHP